MKRRTTVLLLALACLFAVDALAETSIAQMYNFEGDVSLIRDRRTILPDLDQRCVNGDLVRTEPGAFADIILNYTAGLRLLEKTHLLLNNVGSIATHVTLEQGTLLVNLKPIPNASTFDIETDSAMIHLKKGQIFVKIEERNGVPITVVASRVGVAYATVKEANATVQILEGQALETAAGGNIPSVRNANEEETELLAKAQTVYIPDPDA